MPTVRFAPSPTGRLHLGNARLAVVNWLFARHGAGRLILRIDDTDRARSRPEFEAAILEDLAWLGLDWDAFHRQSEREALYADAFARLLALGRVYACYETAEELAAERARQQARGEPPRYRRPAAPLAGMEGRAPYWRFGLGGEGIAFTDLVLGPRLVPADAVSDPVVRRGDGSWTYLFASAVDDGDMGVSHVIRGEDHVVNSACQLEMMALLGHRLPALAHLPLVLGADGAALSKRQGSLSLAELREEGIEPQAVRLLLARLGTAAAANPALGLEALIAGFDLAAFGHAAPRLDPDELRRLSTAVLHHAAFAEVRPRLAALGLEDLDERFWTAIRGNLERLADARQWWAVCREPLAPMIEDPAFLAQAADRLPPALADAEAAAAWLKELAAATGRRGRALYHPLRLALTAREHGPGLQHLLPLIDRERAIRRLRGETA